MHKASDRRLKSTKGVTYLISILCFCNQLLLPFRKISSGLNIVLRYWIYTQLCIIKSEFFRFIVPTWAVVHLEFMNRQFETKFVSEEVVN